MITKKFPDYTREEMLETLMSCYSALVSIYMLTKEDGSHHDEVIFNVAKEPLDEMFARNEDDTS